MLRLTISKLLLYCFKGTSWHRRKLWNYRSWLFIIICPMINFLRRCLNCQISLSITFMRFMKIITISPTFRLIIADLTLFNPLSIILFGSQTLNFFSQCLNLQSVVSKFLFVINLLWVFISISFNIVWFLFNKNLVAFISKHFFRFNFRHFDINGWD